MGIYSPADRNISDPAEISTTGGQHGASERAAAVRRVLWITLGLNALAASIKLGAAWTSGSLALEAGGIDSAFDGIANIAGLVAMRAAARPPDADHPYGHRKFETLTAVIIAGLIFVTCGRLAYVAFGSLLAHFISASSPGAGVAPPSIDVGWFTLAAPVAALLINLFTSRYEQRRGESLSSELLIADAGHTRADAAVSLSVLLGLLAVKAGFGIVDPLLGLGIATFVARVGWGIARETWDVLADAAVLDPHELALVAEAVPGVAGTHKIRSRGAPGAVSVDLHVQVDPQLGIGPAHAIGHDVQERLLELFEDVDEVVVHVEPEWSMAEAARDWDALVAAAAARIDGLGDAHDVAIVLTGAGMRLSAHVRADGHLPLADAHALADALELALRSEAPELERVTIHVEPR